MKIAPVNFFAMALGPLCLLFLGASLVTASAAEPEKKSARDWVLDGMEKFRGGKITESIQSFEQAVRVQPRVRAQLWQLGISYYYAGEFAKGRELFEAHQKVNPQDVENAIWHFLCLAKIEGIDAARKNLIVIKEDDRVPMLELHRLFAGTGSEAEVLKAARGGNPSPEELKNRMFYASLYLGLFNEANGKMEESLKWIRQAAGEFAQNHYMGDVARTHLAQRAKK